MLVNLNLAMLQQSVFMLFITDRSNAVHYVNVSVLIKFSQKTSVFTLSTIKLSIKSYVLDVY